MLVIFLILVSLQPTFDIASLTHNIVAMIIGIIILVIGLAFAVWARVHIGRNWSSEPSIQEGHELVTSGPYRFVRHPIYTGISCALLGTALVGGPVWLIIFIPVLIMFISRIHLEEKFMEETFPNEYPEYKKHTKALIPLIW